MIYQKVRQLSNRNGDYRTVSMIRDNASQICFVKDGAYVGYTIRVSDVNCSVDLVLHESEISISILEITTVNGSKCVGPNAHQDQNNKSSFPTIQL